MYGCIENIKFTYQPLYNQGCPISKGSCYTRMPLKPCTNNCADDGWIEVGMGKRKRVEYVKKKIISLQRILCIWIRNVIKGVCNGVQTSKGRLIASPIFSHHLSGECPLSRLHSYTIICIYKLQSTTLPLTRNLIKI